MKYRIKITIAFVALGAIIGIAITRLLLLPSTGAPNAQVSLTFLRYDPYLGAFAYLSLTNASGKSFRLIEEGDGPSVAPHSPFSRPEESWTVKCEFRDQTPDGWTNWTQAPSPSNRRDVRLPLRPQSGFIIRVPLLPDGRRRKAAVLYEEPAAMPAFWASPIGLRLFRILPLALRNRLLRPKLVLHRAWCAQELSCPAVQLNQK